MGLFSGSKSKGDRIVLNVNDVSRVSFGTFIKGDVSSHNDIRIDGSLEGNIVSDGKVVVGERAVIKGVIVSENVDFSGKIAGQIFAKDTLSLKESACVDGDLHVRRLKFELNSKFNGSCSMISTDEFDSLVASLRAAASPQPSASE